MADSKSTASRKKKRIVKNPETFRERATKATEAGDKPGLLRRLFRAAGKAVGFVIKPILALFGRLFRLKPFKILRKPLRLVGKVLLPTYFRESWRELKQVTWPTWKESRQLTSAVLIFAFVFGAIVAVVDFGLDKLFRDILLK